MFFRFEKNCPEEAPMGATKAPTELLCRGIGQSYGSCNERRSGVVAVFEVLPLDRFSMVSHMIVCR